MTFFTDFADQAVMLPLAAVIAVCLALTGWWRGLMAWLFAVVSVLGTMAILKFACFACSGILKETGIRSPSGHTAASTAIYGGALLLLLGGRLKPLFTISLPLLVGATFGVSRLSLGVHNLAEVLIGGGVGMAGAAAMIAVAGCRPPIRVWPIAAAALLTMVVCHGLRLPAESKIQNLHSSHGCHCRLRAGFPIGQYCDVAFRDRFRRHKTVREKLHQHKRLCFGSVCAGGGISLTETV